jgi:O-6-methylguanine DNA methyltransferase
VRAGAEITEYFAGTRSAFTVPLAPAGTPFQREVWNAIAAIPFGETAAYRDLASRIGRASCIRAAGAATGRNPLSIIVPCHRVVGADGALTGYAGGLERKRTLLALERNAPRAPRGARPDDESARCEIRRGPARCAVGDLGLVVHLHPGHRAGARSRADRRDARV